MKYIADSFNLEPKTPKVKRHMYVVATRFYAYNIGTDTDELCYYTDWQIAATEIDARYNHMQNFCSLYPGPGITIVDTVCGMVPFDDVAKVYISHQ